MGKPRPKYIESVFCSFAKEYCIIFCQKFRKDCFVGDVVFKNNYVLKYKSICYAFGKIFSPITEKMG